MMGMNLIVKNDMSVGVKNDIMGYFSNDVSYC